MDLFEQSRQEQFKQEAPLAYRMRPRNFDEFAGQQHIIGEGKLLRRMVESDRLSSILLWGPPGSGKTTLASIIAANTQSTFETMSAVLDGVKELRAVIERAKERRALHGTRTVLFIDEIHRWNKSQQDSLLPHVEDGSVILIGATTENPAFELNRPLLSRSRVFRLQHLEDDDIGVILQQALTDKERGYGAKTITIDDDAFEHIIRITDGDARNALNALELAVLTTTPDEKGALHIDLEIAQESIQRRAVAYDKGGDEHYDTASAFIKSIRGSDPDAALFWLAKMISAGEDPRFILRRLMISTGEDIGLANPQAVVVVAACAQSFEWMGMPEGLYPIGLATLYCATSPKSNSVTGVFAAMREVENGGSTTVPLHLSTNPMNRNKDDKNYKYPHDYPDHYVKQQYLPDELIGKQYYEPSTVGFEAKIKAWIDGVRGQEKE